MPSTQNKIWFIDANILAHWVLGKGGVLGFLIDKFRLTNEFFDIYSKRYEESINELFSGLKDELRSIILFKNGVPISKWRDSRNNPDIASEDYKAIYEITLKSFDILFGKKNIEYINELSQEDNPNYLSIYSSILFLIKDVKTQDSTLLTTAIINEADYFVTKDDVLIKSAKNLIKDTYGLELIKPAHALQILRRRV